MVNLDGEELQKLAEELKQEQEELNAKEEALAEEAEDIQHLWDEMRNEGHDPVTP
tara:strand:+ start:11921 stop:12085 length:165 start_codon:yes stop_codon:yes gene_type:complete